MKRIIKKKFSLPDESGLQDVIFLFGIFVFISILIIGLFPGQSMGLVINREFFIYAVMTIPAIAAIYFIIMSFRRNLNFDSAFIRYSIRKKMALAFIFMAVVPALPIVLASNYLISQTLSSLFVGKTSSALNEAVTMTDETVSGVKDSIDRELRNIDQMKKSGFFNPYSPRDRGVLISGMKIKDLEAAFFTYAREGGYNRIAGMDAHDDLPGGMKEFFRVVELADGMRTDRVTLSGREYFIGSISGGGCLVAVYRKLPESAKKRMDLFNAAIEDYKNLDYIKTYFMGRVGIFLLGLSIMVIFIAVLISLYLSKNITSPVLELSRAAREIAHGNFNVRMHRDSYDELGMLYDSFNQMAFDLERNRKTMYQKQRLEAWREMARRLVHEIKNPLTPIRLSAERMNKRFLEKHPDIEEIVQSGTKTIIDEVDVLMKILEEFTKFARLPDMKPVKTSINRLIENSLAFFAGHEQVNFISNLDGRIPDIYVDKVLMRQTLTNLIQNAVDAIEDRGTVEIRSELSESAEVKTVTIRVIDDGTGIKEKDIDRIFDPGFSTKPSGTGLGLAIVEKIILEHGGRISCVSNPGAGTQFIIELPMDGGENG